MFDWKVSDQYQNKRTVGRPVLMDAFHIDSMNALDVPTGQTVGKVPLRESGEDDSHLFVLEPNRDGHKDHHAGEQVFESTGRLPG